MYPVIYDFGFFQISSFGVMVALAFLTGGWLMARRLEEVGLPRDAAWSVLTWCMVGGILGAKFWFVGEQLARGVPGPLTQYVFSLAGYTWYGGFLGGVLAGYLGVRANGLPPLLCFNLSAVPLAVGHGIGRIGCFLVGDDYGAPSELPWAVAFPEGAPPTRDPLTGEVFAVQPTMLYETAWLFAAAPLLWLRRNRSPFLFGEYLIAAGLGRFWIEFFRTNPELIAGLTNAQVVAVGLVLLGALGWGVQRARGGAGGTPSPEAEG